MIRVVGEYSQHSTGCTFFRIFPRRVVIRGMSGGIEERFEEVLAQALAYQATDVHFDFGADQCRILARGLNGLAAIPAKPEDQRLFNYLAYQARLDPADPRPQSGSFRGYCAGRFCDFRFAVMPLRQGRSGVLRILNALAQVSADQLTHDREVIGTFRRWLRRRSGLVLFTGLTGSGKTTTLYSLLKELPDKEIYSLEDPVEILQPPMIQINVNDRTGLTYDEGIRQILRHHPDILMIGEIRDAETARMTVRAALTGCLVVSTLHARSLPTAVNRLLELGVDRLELADCLSGLSHQRLMPSGGGRRFCAVYDYAGAAQLQACFERGVPLADRMDQVVARAAARGDIDAPEAED